jgi:(2Fe-2S) ferredoxin
MVVYPEGVWYLGMSVERIPTFVLRHLKEGQPVEEWMFARNPLGD